METGDTVHMRAVDCTCTQYFQGETDLGHEDERPEGENIVVLHATEIPLAAEHRRRSALHVVCRMDPMPRSKSGRFGHE